MKTMYRVDKRPLHIGCEYCSEREERGLAEADHEDQDKTKEDNDD